MSGDDQAKKILKEYDLEGDKYGYVITYSPEVKDGEPINCHGDKVKIIKEMFLSHGFQVEHEDDKEDKDEDASDEESVKDHVTSLKNMSPHNLDEYITDVAREKRKAKCIALYFIVPQAGCNMMTHDKKPLPLFTIWEKLNDVSCPKLFFIQALCDKNAQCPTALLNSNEGTGKDSGLRVPKSSDVLLSYLPDYGDPNVDVAKIVCDELSKPFNINACMTLINHEMEKRKCKGIPKFASTLHKQLYLKESKSHEEGDTVRGPQAYDISDKRKCFVFVFLFEDFGQLNNLNDLSSMMCCDKTNLESAFDELGFEVEFCIQNGRMSAEEFHQKLGEIVGDREKMRSAQCVMIVISSHGDEHGTIKTSSGDLQLDHVCEKLTGCDELNGKPKVIVVDACRGSSFDEPRTPTNPSASSKAVPSGDKKLSYGCQKMKDTLLALSSTEGNMSYGMCGSFFTSSLCNKLKKYAVEYDMLTLLNLVMVDVGHHDIKEIDDDNDIVDARQQATFTSTLPKLLCFPNAKNDFKEKGHDA